MGVYLTERPRLRLIGLRIETVLSETREQRMIPRLQEAFRERVSEVTGSVHLPVTYGVFIDPPDYNPDTDPFTWIAGVEAEPRAEAPEGMVEFELPAATYAVLEYSGDIDRAGRAYDELYRWIQDSEFEQAGTYGFEMYPSDYSGEERRTADFLLHFPVRRKAPVLG
ncbi:putative transcriptional regulator YdeE [Paenibacillus mucilaginosus]|uniref:GyrI-like domain-containing protein n=1 Tax=Paenibacillus mucilaginosus TaxID=61624 RepID=UPI003D1FA002